MDLRRRLRRGPAHGNEALARLEAQVTATGTVLRIPPRTRIGEGFRLVCVEGGVLEVGYGVEFRHGTVIELNTKAEIHIGDQTTFTYFNVLQAVVRVEIGPRCMFAAGASVVDGSHDFSDPTQIRHGGYDLSSVTIGEGVWVASKATVNADVGDHSVIAAGAVVTEAVPPRVLAGGVPARVIREL